MEKEASQILEQAFGKEISIFILDSYKGIQDNFLIKKWKPSELDAGHFVEAVRRAIELELFKKFTPVGKKLHNFDDSILKKYENITGDESFRLLIPRILKAIYNIRNKRGVSHISKVSPNEMDATYILYSTKWVLSEIIRLKSNLPISKTQKLVDAIIERQIGLIWQTKTTTKRILDAKMQASKQILVFLFNQSPLTEAELIKRVEYKNATNFTKLLRYLHKKTID